MVERWTRDAQGFVAWPDGEWVRYSDYAALEAQLAEMTRRRDEWRKKAEGYDDVRRALREKVGTPWPPHMSRLLWAGIAADEKKRADDAEAQLAEARKALETLPFVVQYRRKDGGIQWVDMAAFDVEGAAERYCQSCSGEKSPWEYRFIRRALEGGNND